MFSFSKTEFPLRLPLLLGALVWSLSAAGQAPTQTQAADASKTTPAQAVSDASKATTAPNADAAQTAPATLPSDAAANAASSPAAPSAPPTPAADATQTPSTAAAAAVPPPQAEKSTVSSTSTPGDAAVEAAPPAPEAAPEKPAKKSRRSGQAKRNADEVPFGDQKVGSDSKRSEAVSIFGNTVVDGEVSEAAVAVFGDTIINGKVGKEAVAVMGNVLVNGEVSGQIVAVMGNVTLGPKSIVRGQIVAVGGRVIREEGSQHLGTVQQVGPSIGFGQLGSVADWFQQGVGKARLLWLGSGSGLVWLIALMHLAVYLVLALVLPRGVEACVTTFEERPGMSILAAFLSFLITPLVVVLLAATVIGLPVVIAALFFLSFFSRAVMHAWVGRLFLRPFGIIGSQMHVVLAVLTGGVVLSLIYCVPVLALVVHALLGALGVGVVIYTLILSMKKEKRATLPPSQGPSGMTGGLGAVPPPIPPAPSQAPASAAPAAPFASAAPVAAPVEGAPSAPAPFAAPTAAASFAAPAEPAPTSAASVSPFTATSGVSVASLRASQSTMADASSAPAFGSLPVTPEAAASYSGLPASALPRAGFGVRMGALLIDVLLVSVLINGLMAFHAGPGLLMTCMAAYGAVLWKVRGTTIGGIIFKLQVVRTDDRPLDWPTAVVRALGCVLSVLPAGLGFFWMLFDDEKQTWHDKIAGTTVVRNTSSRSLV